MPNTTETNQMIQRALRKYGIATTGKAFFVHSGTGTNSTGNGQSSTSPLATIDYALGLCTANNGDIIYVMPGHAETFTAAAGIALDVAGVRIVGLGSNQTRPTLTFGTSTATDINVSAANCGLFNLRFVNAIDSLINFLDLDAGQFTCEDCEFITSSTLEALNFVNIATTFDDFTFRGCKFLQPTDPAGSNGAADTGVFYVVDTENMLVERCIFDGFFETAILHNKTTAMKYLTWKDNTVNQQLTDAVRILTPVGTVGMCYGPDTDFIPGRGYPVKRATAAPPSASATTAYFNVNGAPVDIVSFFGEVTTAFATGGGASSLKFQGNPTATGSSVDICAVRDVNTEAVGNLLGITGTFATALQSGLAIVGQSTPVRVQVGTIDATMATTTLASGSAKWNLTWMPVDFSLGVPNVIAV